MEINLILDIIFCVILGLDVLGEGGNRLVGILMIISITLASAIGVGWLLYLTYKGVKNFCKNPNA